MKKNFLKNTNNKSNYVTSNDKLKQMLFIKIEIDNLIKSTNKF